MVSACKEWIQMHSDWCVQSIPQKLSFILLHIIAPQVFLKTAHSIHWSIIILSLCHADAKNIGKNGAPAPLGQAMPSHKDRHGQLWAQQFPNVQVDHPSRSQDQDIPGRHDWSCHPISPLGFFGPT